MNNLKKVIVEAFIRATTKEEWEKGGYKVAFDRDPKTGNERAIAIPNRDNQDAAKK